MIRKLLSVEKINARENFNRLGIVGHNFELDCFEAYDGRFHGENLTTGGYLRTSEIQSVKEVGETVVVTTRNTVYTFSAKEAQR